MNMKPFRVILCLILGVSWFFAPVYAQIEGSRLLQFTTLHHAFPDTGRSVTYIYDSVEYPVQTHYKDSSALVLIPAGFKASGSVDVLVWFHGWHNNINNALTYYHLKEQFLASHKNALLFMPEAARDAPDSYAGKLEQPGEFAGLMEELMNILRKNNIVSSSTKFGNIILAGHSGGYRAIAFILKNGAMTVKEVDLFDALYGDTEKFDSWFRSASGNRMINWYTNEGGGTDEVSIQWMDQLVKEGIQPILVLEDSLTRPLLQKNRIVFIHSKRPHNEIIFNPDNFRLMLETSPFLETIR
jgi:hypothetical protein